MAKKSPFITKQTHQFINCNKFISFVHSNRKIWIFFADNNYALLTPINNILKKKSGIFQNWLDFLDFDCLNPNNNFQKNIFSESF